MEIPPSNKIRLWKRVVQVDLWGKPVPHSKLKKKVRVGSYRKGNGSSVRKYSRKMFGPSIQKAPLEPRVSFKRLIGSGNQASVNLAHSMYVDNLRSELRSVGVPKKTGGGV